MAVIHPRCLIEEYASIFRTLTWFNPPHPPIRTDIAAHTSTISLGIFFINSNNTNKGAIFCQQAIIIPFRNETPLKTSGNQK